MKIHSQEAHHESTAIVPWYILHFNLQHLHQGEIKNEYLYSLRSKAHCRYGTLQTTTALFGAG